MSDKYRELVPPDYQALYDHYLHVFTPLGAKIDQYMDDIHKLAELAKEITDPIVLEAARIAVENKTREINRDIRTTEEKQ